MKNRKTKNLRETYNLYSKQKLHRVLTALLLVAFLLYPLGAVQVLWIYGLCGRTATPTEKTKFKLFILGDVLLVAYIGYLMITQDISSLKQIYLPITDMMMVLIKTHTIAQYWVINYLLGLYPARFIVPIIVLLGYVITDNPLIWNSNKEIAKEEKRQVKYIPKSSDLTPILNSQKHAVILGETGSGKSLMLQHFVEDTLKKGYGLYVNSGKVAGKDKYSLLRVVRALCNKYGRELYVVSTDPNVKDRRRYNPLIYMTTEQIVDLFLGMSEFSEAHYKLNFSSWLKEVLEMMKKADIPYSIDTIKDFYLWEDFLDLIDDLKERKIIDEYEYEEAITFENIAKIAKDSHSRFTNLIVGKQGKFLFENSEDSICAMDCMQNNAVLFLDLDDFMYKDFTKALGNIFVADMNNVVAHERHTESRKRILLDEIAGFVGKGDTSIWSLFSQSRSKGFQVVVATQTKADLEAIDPTFAQQVLGNTGMKIIFRVEDEAEDFANAVGTYKTIETTYKTAGRWIDEAGTKKWIDRYYLSPNEIKNLKDKHCVVINKQDHILKHFVLPYVDFERFLK